MTPRIIDSLGAARIVNIVGPRQVGKSTTVEHQVPIAEYLTMDDDALRAAIDLDPHAVLAEHAERHKHSGKPVAIDEVQRVPAITLALKRIVDNNRTHGQFLLTGSSNIFSGRKAIDSLAGRVRTLTLSPFSAAEIVMARPCLLLDAVTEHPGGVPVHALPAAVPYSRTEAIDLMVRGGFPEIRGLADRERRSRYMDYLNSIIEKDVPPVADIRKTTELRRFLLQLGARTAQELSISAMCDAVGVNWRTMSDWYDVMSQLGIVRHLPAWSSSQAKREIKASKIHLMDTGCATAIRNETAVSFAPSADPTALGAILETFVFVELDKSLPLVNDSWELYHWRRKDHEVDIIAEAPGNRLALFEMKASTTVSASDFAHMDRFFAGPASGYTGTAFVVYLGDRLLPFGPRKIALPLSIFWSYR
ncbi:MAG TPA: ATP-binding protein [Rhodospirillaceae bacterium]|nr:ATP-binding protein [Rhodospirillaceae bacterium]